MMKKFILIKAIIFLITYASLGQNTEEARKALIISSAEAKNYVGKVVKVKGKVVSIYFAKNSKGSPTFINLDKVFPKNEISVVIYKSRMKNFDLKNIENRTVIVEGFVSGYEDENKDIRPSIELKQAKQLLILD